VGKALVYRKSFYFSPCLPPPAHIFLSFLQSILRASCTEISQPYVPLCFVFTGATECVQQANVLIDAHENAVLSDFGLSTILTEFSGTSYMSTSLARGGALRWADPALSHVADNPAQPLTPPSPTLTSDIYSFGCVLYHVSLLYQPLISWE
jgi:hypothetical protein